MLRVGSNDWSKPVVSIPINGRGTGNVCPVAIATCAIAGSAIPPATELVVLPLNILECSGTASNDEDGSIVEYSWTVVEAPAGSTAGFEPDDGAVTAVFVDLAGRYVFNLDVVDDGGCASDAPATVTVNARAGIDSDLRVELVWSTPSDPDETDVGFGAGADLDLHLLHPGGCWEDTTWDCHFRARAPNWGDPGSAAADPSLDVDDSDGAGPEVITLDNPEAGVRYRVGVHYYNDHGYGVSFATVRIYVFGELVFEMHDKEFPYIDYWWEVASIGWSPTEVTAIDAVYDDVPPCL